MKPKYLLVFLILVSAITYSNTLVNRFTAEDYYLIANNDFISGWQNVKVLFGKENLKSPVPIRNGARPLTLLSLMVDYKIWKYNAFGYHFTNVILHSLTAIMVFMLFSMLQVKPTHSFLTALLFAIHPVQGEVVNVPGFRGDLLAAFFFLAGLLLFLKLVKTKNYFYIIAVFCSYLFAVLSKEAAIIFPLVIFAYYFVFSERHKMRALFFSMPLLIFGGLYLMYFWADRYSYDIFKVIFVNLTGTVKPFTSLLAYFNTIFITFFHYVKNLIFPFAVSYEYQFSIPAGFSVVSILSLLIFAYLVWIMFKTRDKVLKFSLVTAAAAYLPASNILPLFNIAADRYLYIPMIAISYLLFHAGYNCVKFIQSGYLGRYLVSFESKLKLKTNFVAGLMLLSMYTGLSFNRNFIFKDMLTLFENTVLEAPTSPRVRYNLAIAYREKHMWKESNDELHELVKLSSVYRMDRVWQMLGENYQLLGDMENAKRYYVKLMLLNPKIETYNNLAKILLSEGNKKGSRLLWQKVLVVDPNNQTAKAGLKLLNSGVASD